MSRITTSPTEIRVELFGVPAILTSRRDMTVVVDGSTLEKVAAALGTACPALCGPVLDRDTGWLLGGYTFVVDDTFTRDPAHPISPNAVVLLVSSVAGG